ncbi:uncharacterized protein LOC134678120 [Cydia fagiglandana]|uniref:uncharacterized protein LOC134678120 n=1 Tax=Cydia fagiglandana TaxID=1458189 RepID=UPI002FEDF9C9
MGEPSAFNYDPVYKLSSPRMSNKNGCRQWNLKQSGANSQCLLPSWTLSSLLTISKQCSENWHCSAVTIYLPTTYIYRLSPVMTDDHGPDHYRYFEDSCMMTVSQEFTKTMAARQTEKMIPALFLSMYTRYTSS